VGGEGGGGGGGGGVVLAGRVRGQGRVDCPAFVSGAATRRRTGIPGGPCDSDVAAAGDRGRGRDQHSGGRLSLDRRGRLDAIAACRRSGSTPLPVGAGRPGTDAVLRGSSRRVAESLACVPRSGCDGSGG